MYTHSKLKTYSKSLVVVMLLNFSNSGQNIFSRPPENIRKPEVFDVLWEYKKEALAWNGFITLFWKIKTPYNQWHIQSKKLKHLIYIVKMFKANNLPVSAKCWASYRNQSSWFVVQIKWLVSIWNAALGWNRLRQWNEVTSPEHILYVNKSFLCCVLIHI